LKNNSQISSTRQKKDGQLLDVEATLSPIRDRSGVIIGMTGICRDVSARKQAEEELKAKTFLLESFIEVIYNQEGPVQRVNKVSVLYFLL
jgi:two-component system, sporulation sensor kinase A